MASSSQGIDRGCNVTIDKFVCNIITQERVPPNRKKIRKKPLSVENFVGRVEEMRKIHSHFSALTDTDANPLNRLIVITGSAGMGKSELAKKFAEIHKSEYPNVAFLDSETKQSLEKSFTELAIELGLVKAEDKHFKNKIDLKQLMPKIYATLSSDYESTLFIFDNAVALESSDTKFGILEFLPQSEYSQTPFILVTSRNPKFWAKICSIFPMSLLPTKEVHKFLMKISESSELTPEVQDLLDKISSIIGGYPLGLKRLSEIIDDFTIANFHEVERNDQRLQDCLKILENINKKLDSRKVEAEERRFEMMKTIFDSKVERILTENEDAVRILGIISFMDVDRIYTEYCCGLFYRTPFPISSGDLQLMKNRDKFSAALKKLRDHNLIYVVESPGESKIKIHRQLQRLTKMRLASSRDVSIVQEIALWCESYKYWDDCIFSHILEDILDMCQPHGNASILEPFFRFILILSTKRQISEDETDQHIRELEKYLTPQTDLRNIVGIHKILFGKGAFSKMIPMIKKPFPKVKVTVENMKLYDEIWKVQFCVDCCQFLSKEHQECISKNLLHRLAGEVQVIQNDLIVQSVVRSLEKCWELLNGYENEEDCTLVCYCVAATLIKLEPQSWLFIVRNFWVEIRKFLKNPKILQEFLKKDWLGWICKILANLNEDNGTDLALQNPESYFEAIIDILRRILLFNANERKTLLSSTKFLEIWKHHTKIRFLNQKQFWDNCTVKAVELSALMVLFQQCELGATTEPAKSLTHVIKKMLLYWSKNSRLLLSLHVLSDDDKHLIQRDIKLFLEDTKIVSLLGMDLFSAWFLIISIQGERVGSTGERFVTDTEIIEGLDSLFSGEKLFLTQWNLHMVLIMLTKLELNNANNTFQKLICWAKKISPKFLEEISFEWIENDLEWNWKTGESCNISVKIRILDLLDFEAFDFWKLKFVLALYNFHGMTGLWKFWTDFKEQIENFERYSFGLTVFSPFFMENLKLLQVYDLNDDVGKLFDFIHASILPMVFTFYTFPEYILLYKRVLESLEDYAGKKLGNVSDGEDVKAASMGSFVLLWLRILHRYLIFPNLLDEYQRFRFAKCYPEEPNRGHVARFSGRGFSSLVARSNQRIPLDESTKIWLQEIADENKTDKTDVTVEAAQWFLHNSVGP